MDYEPIHVESYSGYKVNQHPVVFTFQGRRRDISEIVDRWYEGGPDSTRPEISYFRVRTIDGQVFLLKYVSFFDSWSIKI